MLYLKNVSFCGVSQFMRALWYIAPQTEKILARCARYWNNWNMSCSTGCNRQLFQFIMILPKLENVTVINWIWIWQVFIHLVVTVTSVITCCSCKSHEIGQKFIVEYFFAAGSLVSGSWRRLLFAKYCTTKLTFFIHIYLIGLKLCTHFAPDLTISLLFVKAVTSTIATFS